MISWRIGMALEVETKYFASHVEEWLQHHAGKYVIIHNESLGGFFDDADAAFQRGISQWGNVPFLVKEVSKEDRIEQSPALVYGLINAGA